MMKILEVVGNLEIGGTERMVVDLAKGLKNKGHQIMVCILSKGGPLAEELKQEGIETVVLSKLLLKNKYIFYFVFKLYKLIQKNNFDVLHTHMFIPSFWGRIAGILGGIKVIIASEYNQDYWKKRRHIFIDKALSLFTDKIIVVSSAVKDFVIEKEKIDSHKLILIHNAVDAKKFMPCDAAHLKKEFNISDGTFIVGTVSRLIPQKGQQYFLEAACRISGYPQDIKFLIVGDGLLRGDLESLSERLGLRDKVIFAGLRQELVEFLSILDIFVLPSIWEGLSVTLLGAMAMGKPVITTDIKGVEDLIIDGENGLLVPPKDSEKLAQAMLKLINDELYARNLGLNARKTVEKGFSLKTMIEKTEALYQSFLN